MQVPCSTPITLTSKYVVYAVWHNNNLTAHTMKNRKGRSTNRDMFKRKNRQTRSSSCPNLIKGVVHAPLIPVALVHNIGVACWLRGIARNKHSLMNCGLQKMRPVPTSVSPKEFSTISWHRNNTHSTQPLCTYPNHKHGSNRVFY